MEQSFSEETLLAALRDIRLPEHAAGGGLADLLASIGLALVAALLAVALARMILERRPPLRKVSLADKITRAQALPEEPRRVALLHLLKAHAPDRYQSLASDLYAPNRLDLARLEAEVTRLV